MLTKAEQNANKTIEEIWTGVRNVIEAGTSNLEASIEDDPEILPVMGNRVMREEVTVMSLELICGDTFDMTTCMILVHGFRVVFEIFRVT